MYRALFIGNCTLILLMILVSTTGNIGLTRALQIIVFILSVYLFYGYTKSSSGRRK